MNTDLRLILLNVVSRAVDAEPIALDAIKTVARVANGTLDDVGACIYLSATRPELFAADEIAEITSNLQ